MAYYSLFICLTFLFCLISYKVMPDRYKARLPLIKNTVNRYEPTPLADAYLEKGYAFVTTQIVDPGTVIRVPYLSEEDLEDLKLMEQALKDEEERKIYSKVKKQDGTYCQSMQEYEDACLISRVQSFLNTKENISIEFARQFEGMNYHQRQLVYSQMNDSTRAISSQIDAAQAYTTTSLMVGQEYLELEMMAREAAIYSRRKEGQTFSKDGWNFVDGKSVYPKLFRDVENNTYYSFLPNGDRVILVEEDVLQGKPFLRYLKP